MSGAIPLLPHTPFWRGAQLKHRDSFTFTFTLIIFHEEEKIKKLVKIFQLSVASSLLGPNIILSTFFSDTLKHFLLLM
jgi:hypothetical protein